MKEIAFVHDTAGCRRPQVLLLGNGPERTTGQAAWDALLEKLRAPGVRALTETEKKRSPFRCSISCFPRRPRRPAR